ncbi:aminomethyl-transferring glycine dehydrogenase subunit GcvPB, partial [uncultured Muribaculum sp.]|uniref:aminomethyl-transferring glycine dehydrogenase subunit GcvPB n=1 Tax=uncultured Muribaculum sp. TaxID=1918613 RepID=UPI0026E0E4FD
RLSLLPECDVEVVLPEEKDKRKLALHMPELSENELSRHYTELAKKCHGVNDGFYPLGSCTMKYNPKINEDMAALKGFTDIHPLQPAHTVQGCMEVIKTAEEYLCGITGMERMTFQPAAGAHGEFTGLLLIKAYHESRGDKKRTKIIVPDSAHGTNPASAAVAGLSIVEVKSRPDGTVDVDDLRPLLDDTVAAVMMTNPNTLGIFEKNIPEIASLVHDCGALLYYDGANLNPLVGVARPGDMGFDVMHINLHKTFSTPHGGGGPGSGPVGVRKGLEHLLPNPRVVKLADGSFDVEYKNNTSGQVTGTLGNFAVIVRALAYIMTLGKEGLKLVGPLATLNATYIKEALKDVYLLPIDGLSKHEFVFDGLLDKSTGVTTLNVAKRLLDFGFHAPTIYFPLLFHESLMIEPTETESLETIDNFIAVMRQIAKEASENPDMVKNAPHNTPITHPDDTQAALHPIVTYSSK